MNIAYLMLVHRNPGLLARAVRMLRSPNTAVFVHVDQKSDISPFHQMLDGAVRFTDQRIAVIWGEYSQVEATLLMMRQALADAHPCDYLVLLQGSDYPLRSASYISSFLTKGRGHEFISMVPIPAPGFPLSKINKIRYPSTQPIRRFVSRALAKANLSHRDYHNFLGDMQAYAGDACWALSREACEYVLNAISERPSIEAYFRDTFTPDEMLFHTVLGNSPFRARVKRNLNYRDWPDPGDHPRVLTDAHLDDFERSDRIWLRDQFGEGEALFARKFSDDNLQLVDRMDQIIWRKESVR